MNHSYRPLSCVFIRIDISKEEKWNLYPLSNHSKSKLRFLGGDTRKSIHILSFIFFHYVAYNNVKKHTIKYSVVENEFCVKSVAVRSERAKAAPKECSVYKIKWIVCGVFIMHEHKCYKTGGCGDCCVHFGVDKGTKVPQHTNRAKKNKKPTRKENGCVFVLDVVH